MPTIITCAVLALAAGFVIFIMIRRKKQGKSSCGCGCSDCPNAMYCHKPEKK